MQAASHESLLMTTQIIFMFVTNIVDIEQDTLENVINNNDDNN